MRHLDHPQRSRPGAILPMVALCMIGIMGCLALSIDLGLIASARTQAQAAADSAAMSGARTMNGDVKANNNIANVLPNALASATDNQILSRPIIEKMVTIEEGSYTYNDSTKKFDMAIGPPPSGENYSLVRATVSTADPSLSSSEKIESAFGKVLGMNYVNIETRATAAHRPRDVAVILDHSGSMRFDSLLGIPYTGNRTQSANPDPVFPLFGGYSATGSAALQNSNLFTTIGTSVYGAANISTTTDGGEPIVLDFYQHDKNATPVKAFGPPDVTLPPDSYASTPGGENYQFAHDSASFAQNVQQIIEDSTNAGDAANGWKGYTQPPYAGYTAAASIPEFAGYTQGPNYWGKTFWIWPPDPRPANDWRQKFFGTTDNTRLYDSSGNWKAAEVSGATNYDINYNAILNWIKNAGPNPFPPKLRAGRILYYDSIPTSISGDFPSDPNERFWKLYIDYVLGLCQIASNDYDVITSMTGYGADFTWGAVRITAPYNATGQINRSGGYSAGFNSNINLDNWNNGSGPSIGHRLEVPTGSNHWYTVVSGSGSSPRLDRPLVVGVDNNDPVRVVSTNIGAPYFDNPKRPKLHFWFGPMTMVDFLGNYNLATNSTYDNYYDFRWPGTCHEAPLYTQKLGVRASLQDMERNHPNDFVSMMMFSTPKYSSGGAGQFNRTRGPLGRKYRRLEDALFYPPDTIADDSGGATANDIGAFDAAANNEVPRSEGGTTPVMGFMLAYNQFSSNATLKTWAPAPAPEGEAGGLGRKGAQKLVIFLTDGVANTAASAGFNNAGSHNSYYQIRQPGELPSNSGTVSTQLYGVVDRICALETSSPSGYSTTRKPVLIHSLAFGTLFEPSTTSSDKSTALGILQNVAWRGKTLNSASTPLPDENRIVGDSDTRVEKLQAAFKRIMQDGVQVSLLE